MKNIFEKLQNVLGIKDRISKIHQEKSNNEYDIIKECSKSNLIFIKEFLQEFKNSETIGSIIKKITNELDLRDNIRKNNLTEVKEKYLNQYVKIILRGLGTYIIFKVVEVKEVNKEIRLYYYNSISNIDGCYDISINDSYYIYHNNYSSEINIITKEEYDSEFEKAIKYYRDIYK